jgi:hypothetical protein
MPKILTQKNCSTSLHHMRHARRIRLFSALMCATAAGLAPAHVASSQQSRRAALGSLTGLCAIAVAPSPSAAKLDAASARSQLEASETAVDDLLQRFDAITAAEGGDGVRRVLGTVGVKSPLFRVEIAAKLLARESEEDPEAAFEAVEDLMAYISNADGEAYSSIFVPTGGGTTPGYWLGRSKKEVVKVRASLRRILELK